MIPLLFETPLLALCFLFLSFSITLTHASLLKLGRFKANEELRSSSPPKLFIKKWLRPLFPKHEWDNLYFSLAVSKQMYQLAYAVFAFFFALSHFPMLQEKATLHEWTLLIGAGFSLIAIALFVDFLARLLAHLWSRLILKLASPIASLSLAPLFPLLLFLLQLTHSALKKVQTEEETLVEKGKLRELIRESELQHHLDPTDQKLISSFVSFKERVAKEIMIPRVDLFSLPADTPLREAAPLFVREGYSRVPIYKESLDQIIGVVLYKDLLKYYTQQGQNLNAPLKELAKPVLYTPENKKVSSLLQEFRTEQSHMAIVVDEYGGTEGIVTIEDILEELVGEIDDEYDTDEENSFWELTGGGWVVDAKMTLIDIEEKLGIQIPDSADYETLGGYIYHCAGTIPNKGWRLSHDEFDLQVLSSNERAVQRVKILPRKHPL